MLMMLPFQSELEFQGMINKINAGRPQCPVGLNTLVLPSKGSLNLHEKHPYVYLACGHVHGKHEWGQGDSENRTCPLCMEVGQVVNCCHQTNVPTRDDGKIHALHICLIFLIVLSCPAHTLKQCADLVFAFETLLFIQFMLQNNKCTISHSCAQIL